MVGVARSSQRAGPCSLTYSWFIEIMSNNHQHAGGTVAKIKNGRFTIVSGATGEHRTFQIKTVIANDQMPPDAFCNKMAGKRIVSLLTGPDNESNYEGFGFAEDDGISVWWKRRGGKFDQYARILWRFAIEGQFNPESGRITVDSVSGYMLCEGKCVRCNRTLTHPQSIESGIGPVCAGR